MVAFIKGFQRYLAPGKLTVLVFVLVAGFSIVANVTAPEFAKAGEADNSKDEINSLDSNSTIP